jgi:acetolactate synthase-1/2/3 large subunit
MKLSHYIANALQYLGVTHAFGVQGGAVVHLFDSLHSESNITVCYTHHEQSAALAAVSNAKFTGRLGVCVTTTGPAATNALTGLLAAWQDSTPVLFISGQTRLSQTSYGLNVRQRGSQECNILDVVRPWTKYSSILENPSDITQILNEAYTKAMEGRPGPVWIDLPVDLQWSNVSVDTGLSTASVMKPRISNVDHLFAALQLIASAKRPLIVMGRLPYREDALNKFLSTIQKINIPIASTWGSATIAKGSVTSAGIIGVSGQPAANYSIRASDCLVFIGCHFSITQSGSNYASMADGQSRIFVNIDQEELAHAPAHLDSFLVNIDANKFLEFFVDNISHCDLSSNVLNRQKWIQYIEYIVDALSPQRASLIANSDDRLSPHLFLCALYAKLKESDLVVIDGGGCALYAGFQCIPSHAMFKVICSTSISAMGTGLPELCGAGITNTADSVNICVIGDGSLMFNIQELQTVKTNLNSSIIIVINNSGYLAIRHTQKEFLDGRFYGTSGSGFGVEIPSIRSIANAFALEYILVDSNDQIDVIINELLSPISRQRHLLVELIVSPNHSNLFTASFIKNSENSYTQQDLHLMEPFANFEYSLNMP